MKAVGTETGDDFRLSIAVIREVQNVGDDAPDARDAARYHILAVLHPENRHRHRNGCIVLIPLVVAADLNARPAAPKAMEVKMRVTRDRLPLSTAASFEACVSVQVARSLKAPLGPNRIAGRSFSRATKTARLE